MILKKISKLDLLTKLEYWCSYQERCEYDIELKMLQYDISNLDKIQIINHLKQNNFLNQERFVHTYIRGKIALKKDGIQKIKYALYAKKIDKSLVESAFETLDTALYQKNLDFLIHKKFLELCKKNDKKIAIQKTIRFLLSKGYSLEIALKSMKKMNF